MLGRRFPVPKLLEEVVVRMVRLLRSLAQAGDDHSCHSLEPARPQHVEFQAILGSNFHISNLHTKVCQISYLVISNIIVGTHALYLHRTEHPANVIDVFNVSGSGLWRFIINKSHILKPVTTLLSSIGAAW